MTAALGGSLDAITPALVAVRERLEAIAADPAAVEDPWILPLTADSPLDRLREAFGLSTFEVTIVALAAGIELIPGLDRLCGAISGDRDAEYPTFALVTLVASDAHWNAFTPDAPLRRHHLVELEDGPVLTSRPIRIAERVLHALLDVESIDPRLARRGHHHADVGQLPASHEMLAQHVASWSRASDEEPRPRVHLWSNDLEMATDVAVRGVALQGRSAHVLDAAALPVDPTDTEMLSRLWGRELRLSPVALVLVLSPALAGRDRASVESFCSRLEGPLVVIAREPPQASATTKRLEVPALPFEETLALWKDVLEGGTHPGEHDLRDIAAQFSLGPSAIRRAAVLALEEETASGSVRHRLWHACRALARPRMADLAQHVDVRASLEDLVLPPPQIEVLHALVGQVRHRATVFHAWGFAERLTRGAGLSAVFAGPSGTGKTMAAEAIARALDLDLYRIDLSAVVSKYIGETEENLRQVFDAAEAGGAVLLFDEADALFGKRTEVRDSHDRHANIEVSYLLQRMETYAGLAILTTNLRKSIDDAFLRRVQFIVDFPFPEASLRARIWEGAFPRQTPTLAIDYDKLARLSVAGGNICSIVRNAAYIAAGDGQPIGMGHILKAARLEFDKLGRSLPPAEIRGWVA